MEWFYIHKLKPVSFAPEVDVQLDKANIRERPVEPCQLSDEHCSDSGSREHVICLLVK